MASNLCSGWQFGWCGHLFIGIWIGDLERKQIIILFEVQVARAKDTSFHRMLTRVIWLAYWRKTASATRRRALSIFSSEGSEVGFMFVYSKVTSIRSCMQCFQAKDKTPVTFPWHWSVTLISPEDCFAVQWGACPRWKEHEWGHRNLWWRCCLSSGTDWLAFVMRWVVIFSQPRPRKRLG